MFSLSFNEVNLNLLRSIVLIWICFYLYGRENSISPPTLIPFLFVPTVYTRHSPVVWRAGCGWKCLPLPGLFLKNSQVIWYFLSCSKLSGGSEVPLYRRLPTKQPVGLGSKGEINSVIKPLKCCYSTCWHVLIFFPRLASPLFLSELSSSSFYGD